MFLKSTHNLHDSQFNRRPVDLNGIHHLVQMRFDWLFDFTSESFFFSLSSTQNIKYKIQKKKSHEVNDDALSMGIFHKSLALYNQIKNNREPDQLFENSESLEIHSLSERASKWANRQEIPLSLSAAHHCN